MILFAIHDKKAESFGPVYTSKNIAVCTRDFGELCQNQETNYHKFPEDYEVVLLAEYNENNGEIKTTEKRIITTALNFVNKGDKK